MVAGCEWGKTTRVQRMMLMAVISPATTIPMLVQQRPMMGADDADSRGDGAGARGAARGREGDREGAQGPGSVENAICAEGVALALRDLHGIKETAVTKHQVLSDLQLLSERLNSEVGGGRRGRRSERTRSGEEIWEKTRGREEGRKGGREEGRAR
eukprot:3384426-Rhodomonas_salina.1